jgi:hypothetical protein
MFVSAVVGVLSLCMLCLPGNATETNHPGEGFSASTTIELQFDMNGVPNSADYNFGPVTIPDRLSWYIDNGGYGIDGKIILTGGSGVQSENVVMLYGERQGPLYTGEQPWEMFPRPVNVFLGYGETSYAPIQLTFGPRFIPQNITEWTQVYKYTAKCDLINGGSSIGEGILNVKDGN